MKGDFDHVMPDYRQHVRTAILREVCPAKNTLLGKQIECDRGIGHDGPHMTKESWQWFDDPERGES